jgi:LemA protein
MNPILITVILLFVAGFVWYLYNSIIVAKIRVSESLSHIDVQLKRRADLIPNLIETVKGYAKHEKELLEKVTRERANLVSAKTPGEKAKADNQLSETIKSIFAVAESYPDLKASQNFSELQEELSDTENKIAYSRQFYNSNVLDYNTKLTVFPNVLFARMFNFKEAEFFEAENEEKKSIKVKF